LGTTAVSIDQIAIVAFFHFVDPVPIAAEDCVQILTQTVVFSEEEPIHTAKTVGQSAAVALRIVDL
jgi:hypothetical protein